MESNEEPEDNNNLTDSQDGKEDDGDGRDEKRRPKRSAAQRASAFFLQEQTSVLFWNEERDLKKALQASLVEARRNAAKKAAIATASTSQQNAIKGKPGSSSSSSTSKKNSNKSKVDQASSSTVPSSKQNRDVKSVPVETNAETNKKLKIPAQRKFSQGAGTISNSIPIKIVSVAPTPIKMTEVFTKNRPSTEDFLSFLCLRGTSVMPKSMDFIALNKKDVKPIKEEKENNLMEEEVDIEFEDEVEVSKNKISRSVESKKNNANHKGNNLGSKTSVKLELNFKLETNESISKLPNGKRKQILSESIKKKICSKPKLGRPARKCESDLDDTKNSSSTLEALKEKYKQQRLAKGPMNVIETHKNKSLAKPSSESKAVAMEKTDNSIVTAGRRTVLNKKLIKPDKRISKKNVEKVVNKPIEQRVLRSHHQTTCSTPPSNPGLGRTKDSLSKAQSSHTTLTRTHMQLKPKKIKGRSSSPLGVRPHERKAKPKVPLIDYHFESASEDSDANESNEDERKQESKQLTTKKEPSKSLSIPKMSSNIQSPTVVLRRTPLPNSFKQTIHIKSTSNSTPVQTSNSKLQSKSNSVPNKRVTRSSSTASVKKEETISETEKKIKLQMLEIEKRHQALRRFSSESSLHSSTSSSSSESLPISSSSSSSSSINIPRITRSLENLKQLRVKYKKKEAKIKGKMKKQLAQAKSSKPQKEKNEAVQEELKVVKGQNKRTRENITNSQVKKVKVSKASQKLNQKVCPKPSCSAVASDAATTCSSTCSEDIDKALRTMAEGINSLNENGSEDNCVPDIEYCDTEPIQGLMTSEFSGAFSEETVTTAMSAMLPSTSMNQTCTLYANHSDVPIQTKLTCDASTNTTEEEILACTGASSEVNEEKSRQLRKKETSVGTQTNQEAESYHCTGKKNVKILNKTEC